MNLSRSEGQRKLSSLSLMRWLVVAVGFIVFVMISFVLYVRSADSDYRSAEDQAKQIAIQNGGLIDVTNVVSHTWDEMVWVVTGSDSNGQVWMVWERASELVKLKVDENMSEKRMVDRFSQEHAGLKLIRIIPGWFEGEPVWEIRYWNDSRNHQSIDFYSFKDGTLLRTYVLSSQ